MGEDSQVTGVEGDGVIAEQWEAAGCGGKVTGPGVKDRGHLVDGVGMAVTDARSITTRSE